MLNLDTHILVFLLAGELTQTEIDCLQDQRLAISDIVLWEIAKLRQLGRLQIDLASSDFEECLRQLQIFPISMPIAQKSTELDFTSDPADEIISATSIVEKIPLLTRDKRILKSKMVPFA